MQKKLIALAIAGLAAAPAFAQTNVTIYGVADVSFENVRTSGAEGFEGPLGIIEGNNANYGQRNRVTPNSSYIGFRGTEDLGNGMKALFLIESGINLDTNSGFAGGRDSYVGVSSGFGTVLFGQATGPFRALGARYDLTPGATGIGSLTGNGSTSGGLGQGWGILGQVGSGNIGSTSGCSIGCFNSAGGAGYTFNSRTPNVIAYVTPDLAGFKAVVGYSANEGKSQEGADPATNPYAWELGLGYANGPFNIDFAYRQHKNLSGLASSYYGAPGLADLGIVAPGADVFFQNVNQGSDQKGYRLGASWAFGFGLKLAGIYEYLDYKDQFNFLAVPTVGGPLVFNGTRGVDRWAFSLGASYDINQHNFIVQGGYADDLSGDVSSANDTSGNMWMLRYAYNFSKRSQMYALYSMVNNGNDVNYDYGGGSTDPLAGGNLPAGSTIRGFGIGVRHTF